MKVGKTRFFFLIVFLTASVLTVHGQHVEELYSPYFLGLGPQETSLEAPIATELNPAAAGLEQRIRLELNWNTLIGSALNPGWGNALNLGLTLPTRIGAFSFAGFFMGTPATMVRPNLGSMGGLTISFSKDLLPNFLVGLGVEGVAGS